MDVPINIAPLVSPNVLKPHNPLAGPILINPAASCSHTKWNQQVLLSADGKTMATSIITIHNLEKEGAKELKNTKDSRFPKHISASCKSLIDFAGGNELGWVFKAQSFIQLSAKPEGVNGPPSPPESGYFKHRTT